MSPVRTLPEWLHSSNGLRNVLPPLNPLLPPDTRVIGLPMFIDLSVFGPVNGARGRERILVPNEAAAVRHDILTLPPTKHHSPIGDRQWMRLAKIQDHNLQQGEFQELLKTDTRQLLTF